MHNPVSKIVHTKLARFLDKVFSFSKRDNTYAEELLLAAASNTYVETVEGKADSLHWKIKQCDWEHFLAVYQHAIRSYVRTLNIRSGVLAFDITAEPFYGKTNSLYLIGCEDKEGYKQEFEFLVMSLINDQKQEKIPLACIPVHLGFDCARAIKELLTYAKTLLKVRLVVLDRGFYSADVLQAVRDVRYIMLIPKLDSKMQYLSAVVATACHYYHKVKGNTGSEALTRIVLVRDPSDAFTWSFATNMILSDHAEYVFLYKKRWRIETNFRVEDEARIKSKSIFPIVRYFYFLISLLLHTFWLVFNRETPFKAFLIHMAKEAMLENLGIEHASAC